MPLRLNDPEGQFFETRPHSQIQFRIKFVRLLWRDLAEEATRIVMARRQYQYFKPVMIALDCHRDRKPGGRARGGKA